VLLQLHEDVVPGKRELAFCLQLPGELGRDGGVGLQELPPHRQTLGVGPGGHQRPPARAPRRHDDRLGAWGGPVISAVMGRWYAPT
jgi:hypothetical protein